MKTKNCLFLLICNFIVSIVFNAQTMNTPSFHSKNYYCFQSIGTYASPKVIKFDSDCFIVGGFSDESSNEKTISVFAKQTDGTYKNVKQLPCVDSIRALTQINKTCFAAAHEDNISIWERVKMNSSRLSATNRSTIHYEWRKHKTEPLMPESEIIENIIPLDLECFITYNSSNNSLGFWEKDSTTSPTFFKQAQFSCNPHITVCVPYNNSIFLSGAKNGFFWLHEIEKIDTKIRMYSYNSQLLKKSISTIAKLATGMIVTAEHTGAIKIWRLSKKKTLYPPVVLKEHKSAVTALVKIHRKCFISGDVDGHIKIWNLIANDLTSKPRSLWVCSQTLSNTSMITGLIKLGHTTFAATSNDGFINIYQKC